MIVNFIRQAEDLPFVRVTVSMTNPKRTNFTAWLLDWVDVISDNKYGFLCSVDIWLNVPRWDLWL